MNKQKHYTVVNNGIDQHFIKLEDLDVWLDKGFKVGALPYKQKRYWYTNGVEDRHFINEPVPDGWVRGRTNCGKGNKGYIFINNGVDESEINAEYPIPQGWVVGRLPFTEEHKDNISKALTGKERSETHCKHLSESHKTESYKNNIEATMLELYGVRNAFQLDKVLEYNKSEQAIIIRNNTKRINGTFNSYRLEDEFYERLKVKLPNATIRRNYSRDARYPFACDFYIEEEDLFIEINGFATHMTHPFDANNIEDLNLKHQLEEKGDSWSKAILDVWCVRDVRKIKMAKDSNLRYVVFYGMNIDTPVISFNYNYC